MSNIQQVALVRGETPFGFFYCVHDFSMVQKGGIFDQIEYDRTGDIIFSKYQCKRGDIADWHHFLVYSEAHRTQRDLALAVERAVKEMNLSPRESRLEDIHNHLSIVGYIVGNLVSPAKDERKGTNSHKSRETNPFASRQTPFCADCNTCYDAPRDYQGGTQTPRNFNNNRVNMMGALLEEILRRQTNRYK